MVPEGWLGSDALGFAWDDQTVPGLTVRSMNVDLGISTVLFRYRVAIPEFLWDAETLDGRPIPIATVQTVVDGLADRADDDDIRRISNLVDAHRELDNLVRTGEFRLSKEVSDKLHALVSTGEVLDAGRFRGEGAASGTPTVTLSDGTTYEPPETEQGAANLIDSFERGTEYLEANVRRVVSRAIAYFAFASRQQFYFDANKRVARMMMNGVLLSNRIDAISVSPNLKSEWELALLNLFSDADPQRLFQLLADRQPEIRFVRSGRIETPNWGDGRDWAEVTNLAYEATSRPELGT